MPRERDTKADLILVDRGYLEWVLVEVEISNHSWTGHVRDQIERFELAEISKHEVQKLCSRAVELDSGRTLSLLTTQPPRILVVCDGAPRWSDQLHSTSAELLIATPFRDELNQLIIQCNRPFRRRRRIGLTSLAPPTALMPNWYKITDPHAFDVREADVQVLCDNRVFSGKIRSSGSSWYLVLASSIQLLESDQHIVLNADENTIEISGRLAV